MDRSIPRAALFDSGLPDAPEPLSVLPSREYLDNVPDDDRYYLLGDINSSSFDQYLVGFKGVHGLSSRAFLTYIRSVCVLKPTTLVSGSFSFEGVYQSDLPGWYNRVASDGGMFISGIDMISEDGPINLFPKFDVRGVYSHQGIVSCMFPLPGRSIRVNLTIEEFRAYIYDGQHSLSNAYMRIPKQFVAHGSFKDYEYLWGKQNVARPIKASGTLWIDRVPKSSFSKSFVYHCPAYNWVKIKLPFSVGHCFYNIICLDHNDRVQPVYWFYEKDTFVVFVKCSVLFFYLDVGHNRPKRFKAKLIPLVSPTQLLRYNKGTECDLPSRLRKIFLNLHSKMGIETIVDVFSGVFPLEWSFVAISGSSSRYHTSLVCPKSISRPIFEAGFGAIITTSRSNSLLPYCTPLCEHSDSVSKSIQTISINMSTNANPYARAINVLNVKIGKGDTVILIAAQPCVLDICDFSRPKRKLVIEFPGCGKPRNLKFVPCFSDVVLDLPVRDCGFETFSRKRYKENGIKSDFDSDFYSRLTILSPFGPQYCGENPYGLFGSSDNPGTYLTEVCRATGADVNTVLRQDGFSRNDKYFVNCENNVSLQRYGANCFPWCNKHPGGNGRWITSNSNVVHAQCPNVARFLEYGGHVDDDDRSDYGEDHCEDEACDWAGEINGFNNCSDNPISYYKNLGADEGVVDLFIDDDIQFYKKGDFVSSILV